MVAWHVADNVSKHGRSVTPRAPGRHDQYEMLHARIAQAPKWKKSLRLAKALWDAGSVVWCSRCHGLQRQVRGRGRQQQVIGAVQDAREHLLVRIEELAEVVAAQLDARQFPPVIERIDIRVAANRVRNQLLALIGPALAMFGEPVHALVLDQDDAALVGDGLGQDRSKRTAFEEQSHEIFLHGIE